MNRTTSADLLRDVAQAIIDSGYAVNPGDKARSIHIAKRVKSRAADIALIAHDDRLNSSVMQPVLIRDVMYTFGVTACNARTLISRARRKA